MKNNLQTAMGPVLRSAPTDKSMGFSRVSLTGRKIILRLTFFAAFCFTAAINTYAECHYKPELCEQIANADAVIYGTALEEKLVPIRTKGGSDASYLNVLFEVEKSWKLVDRKRVWVRGLSRSSDECGYSGIGKKHLVFAIRVNDALYIRPQSGTRSESAAADDLEDLGVGTVALRPGTFWLYRTFAWGMLLLFALMSLLGIYFYKLNKRPIEKVWA